MEAVSDKESDGSPEELDEGNEKKKKKSSKVRISLSLIPCVFPRITARGSSRKPPSVSQIY